MACVLERRDILASWSLVFIALQKLDENSSLRNGSEALLSSRSESVLSNEMETLAPLTKLGDFLDGSKLTLLHQDKDSSSGHFS